MSICVERAVWPPGAGWETGVSTATYVVRMQSVSSVFLMLPINARHVFYFYCISILYFTNVHKSTTLINVMLREFLATAAIEFSTCLGHRKQTHPTLLLYYVFGLASGLYTAHMVQVCQLLCCWNLNPHMKVMVVFCFSPDAPQACIFQRKIPTVRHTAL